MSLEAPARRATREDARDERRAVAQSATELAAAIRGRELRRVEVMERAPGPHRARSTRCSTRSSRSTPSGALRGGRGGRSRRSRAATTPGPLHGLPIAIKDLEDTAGHAHDVRLADLPRPRADGGHAAGRAAAPRRRDRHRQDEHARVRRRLADLQPRLRRRRATPTTSRARRAARSGGAAAAVASGMLPLADGSDLGASIRNPASFCNLVGLRPSPGRVPARAGARAPWSPMRRPGADRRARSRTRRCCCAPSPARTRARRCRSTIRPGRSCTARPSTSARRGSRGAATSAACPSSPR